MSADTNKRVGVQSPASLLTTLQAIKQQALELIALEKTVDFPFQGSNPEAEELSTLIELVPALKKALFSTRLDYMDPWGITPLREAIAARYQQIDSQQVLVTTGAEAALYFIGQTLLQPGDHVVLQHPCYSPLLEILVRRGCRISFWTPTNQRFQWEGLAKLLNGKTRCILTNSPHNPTGLVLSERLKQKIARLAHRKGILWISDEAYLGLEDTPAQAACDLSSHAISVGSLSKSFGFPGLRIGWMACRKSKLTEQVFDYVNMASLGLNPLTQVLAQGVLTHSEIFLEKHRAQMQHNRTLLEAFIEENAKHFSWIKPQAGTVAFPQLKLPQPIEQFCLTLAKREGVLFLPGTLFLDSQNHFRVNLVRPGLEEALTRLARFIRQRHPR